MLPPEEYFGNIEYKRNILNKNKDRLEELATQLNFRLNEGNGTSIYYLGIEDDGNISYQNSNELNESLKSLKNICKIIKSNIISIQKKELYYKVRITKNKRKGRNIIILLLGDTKTGKTSFLSNLLKRKIGVNNNLFMLKHKHEIQTGKTSSFTYHRFSFNNINYIFIDTPGDNRYIKTTNKIIDQSRFNLVILFYKRQIIWNLEDKYQKIFYKNNTPVLRLNYYSTYNYFPKYNNFQKINRKKFFKNINKISKIIQIVDRSILELNRINIISSTITNIGNIISGFVYSGSFKQGDIVCYNNNYKIVKFKIKSIHFNEKEIEKININNFCSILISNEIKVKNSFIYMN
tara:strand:+ start:6196 stop:7239 length:1044 start_codon:yes stop_codon:yes gene_type:complete